MVEEIKRGREAARALGISVIDYNLMADLGQNITEIRREGAETIIVVKDAQIVRGRSSCA